MKAEEAILKLTTRPDLDQQVLDSPFFKFYHRLDIKTCNEIAALIEAQSKVVEELTKHILTTCGFARGQAEGVSWPDTTDGKCDGYQVSANNDEPHSTCMKCPVCYFNEESALAELDREEEK
jgi:hypothetical protein